MKSHHSVAIHTDVPPTVELDSEAHAAYVRFSKKPVASTQPILTEKIIVTLDLDKDGEPVGVELVGVDEFGIFPLLEKAGLKIPENLGARARYVPANLATAS